MGEDGGKGGDIGKLGKEVMDGTILFGKEAVVSMAAISGVKGGHRSKACGDGGCGSVHKLRISGWWGRRFGRGCHKQHRWKGGKGDDAGAGVFPVADGIVCIGQIGGVVVLLEGGEIILRPVI